VDQSEQFSLKLDLGNTAKDARDAAKAIDEVKKSSEAAAKAGEGLESSMRTVSTVAAAGVVPSLKQIQAQAKAAEKAHADFGRGIQSAAYAVQDFTSVLSGGQGLGRALGSIQNNIPQLLTTLGLGAGLAGVVSLVSVGVGLLIDNWDTLKAAFDGSATKEEVKAMEKLAEATKKANEQAVKMAEGVEGGEVGKRKRDARTALADYGGSKKLLDDLSNGNEQDRVFFANEINEALRGDEGSARLLGLQNSKFGQLYGNAQAADDIKADEAENERRVKEREQRREREQKEDEVENERRVKQRERAAKAAENLTDDLNAQGQQIQTGFEKELDAARKEEHAKNEAAAQANLDRMTPQQRQRMTERQIGGLQSKLATFEPDALAERGQGIEGPATKAYNAIAAQLDSLLNTIERMNSQNQMLADKFNQVGGRINQINQSAETVPTTMDYGW
jgi:hypothetical protein